MMGKRQDIIGDLFRLRLETLRATANTDVDQLRKRLELLSAVAVAQGMSHNIVTKASDIPRERLDTLLHVHADHLDEVAESEGYRRYQYGIVSRVQTNS